MKSTAAASAEMECLRSEKDEGVLLWQGVFS